MSKRKYSDIVWWRDVAEIKPSEISEEIQEIKNPYW